MTTKPKIRYEVRAIRLGNEGKWYQGKGLWKGAFHKRAEEIATHYVPHFFLGTCIVKVRNGVAESIDWGHRVEQLTSR